MAEKVIPSQVRVSILNRAAQETIGTDLNLPESALRHALNTDVFVRTRLTERGRSHARIRAAEIQTNYRVALGEENMPHGCHGEARRSG